MIFLTPQFDRSISKVKQFYRLKLVSRNLKEYKKLVQVSKAKGFSVILYDF